VQQIIQIDCGFDACPKATQQHLQFGIVRGTKNKTNTLDSYQSGTQTSPKLSVFTIFTIHGSGADIWDVVHREVPPRHCPVGCHCLHCKDKDAWLDVAESLKLTDEQKCKAMLSRYIASLLARCPVCFPCFGVWASQAPSSVSTFGSDCIWWPPFMIPLRLVLPV